MERPSDVQGFFEEFALSTSAHGIPRVGSARSTTGRAIWSLIFLGCLGMFTYQVFTPSPETRLEQGLFCRCTGW